MQRVIRGNQSVGLPIGKEACVTRGVYSLSGMEIDALSLRVPHPSWGWVMKHFRKTMFSSIGERIALTNLGELEFKFYLSVI